MHISNANRTKHAIGRWTYVISIAPDYCRREYAWRVLQLGLCKWIREIPEGTEPQPGDYRGFLFTMRFWFPVIVERWR